MDLRKLQAFVALAEEQNFTRAGKRLHRPQADVTVAIQRLENKLGVRLFNRGNRSTTITPKGMAFLKHARAGVFALTTAQNAITPDNSALSGRLIVGLPLCCSDYVPVAEMLGSFQRAFPEVTVMLRSLENKQIIKSVLADEVDIAFCAVLNGKVPGSVYPLHRRLFCRCLFTGTN